MKIVAYTTILFAASFVNALPVAQQQQQPQQQQQQQQQPQQNQPQQQCTMAMLKGYMITSPVNFVAEPQQVLPERGQFVDPTNTTILLSNPQYQGNQQGGNQTVPVKFNNQTEVSTEILQNSVYAISWMKTSDSGQGGQGQQSQSGQGGQGQQSQSGQGVQAQQAQQGGQGRQGQQGGQRQGGQGQKSQQQMISPIRVQLVSQNGTLLNVTETLGVLSTGGQKQQQQSGQQQSGQQQGNQTSQMQAAQQQQGDQNQPQSGQQQGNQSSQQQPASGRRKPGQEGAVVVHLGPEIQPGIYSFLLSAQVQPQQQGGQQQQQQQQQQGPLCQIMTMPFRIRAASDLQQSGSSGNSTSST